MANATFKRGSFSHEKNFQPILGAFPSLVLFQDFSNGYGETCEGFDGGRHSWELLVWGEIVEEIISSALCLA